MEKGGNIAATLSFYVENFFCAKQACSARLGSLGYKRVFNSFHATSLSCNIYATRLSIEIILKVYLSFHTKSIDSSQIV